MNQDEWGYIEGTDYASAYLTSIICCYSGWFKDTWGREPTHTEIEDMLREEGHYKI